MTLTTHAIIGAAAAKIFSFNPILAGLAAFASHFIIDAIPHWDYQPKSFTKDPNNPMNNNMKVGKDFMRDLTRISGDASCGVIFSLFIFPPENVYLFFIIMIGAFFGIIPDPLQYAYWKIRREPLISLQKFHIWIHSKNKKLSIERRWVVGTVLQAVLVIFVVGLTKFYFGV